MGGGSFGGGPARIPLNLLDHGNLTCFLFFVSSVEENGMLVQCSEFFFTMIFPNEQKTTTVAAQETHRCTEGFVEVKISILFIF